MMVNESTLIKIEIEFLCFWVDKQSYQKSVLIVIVSLRNIVYN